MAEQREVEALAERIQVLETSVAEAGEVPRRSPTDAEVNNQPATSDGQHDSAPAPATLFPERPGPRPAFS